MWRCICRAALPIFNVGFGWSGFFYRYFLLPALNVARGERGEGAPYVQSAGALETIMLMDSGLRAAMY